VQGFISADPEGKSPLWNLPSELCCVKKEITHCLFENVELEMADDTNFIYVVLHHYYIDFKDTNVYRIT